MSRQYGKRLREFIGGKIDGQGACSAGRFQEVQTVARLQGTIDAMIADLRQMG